MLSLLPFLVGSLIAAGRVEMRWYYIHVLMEVVLVVAEVLIWRPLTPVVVLLSVVFGIAGLIILLGLGVTSQVLAVVVGYM